MTEDNAVKIVVALIENGLVHFPASENRYGKMKISKLNTTALDRGKTIPYNDTHVTPLEFTSDQMKVFAVFDSLYILTLMEALTKGKDILNDIIENVEISKLINKE